MAKQLFLNNFETTFITAIKDTPVTGTPASELGYGILNVNTSTAAALTNPTGGDYYILTALKRSGSVESSIEIMKVTAVDTTTFPGECRLTVLRAQEGTTAKAFLTGDYFALRQTKGALDNMLQSGDKDLSNGFPGLTLFKLNMRNAANTITSWFTTAATVARTWTMPDKDGTVAMTSDITGTNSGTNTGDNSANSLYSGLVTNATHTGDATGATALTVVRINGVALSGLATGLLKNTTGTGVPSIAAAADITGQLLTGYTSGAGTVAATDTILQAIQKLNANDATNANLTGAVTSSGNATSLGSFSLAQLNTAVSDADVASTVSPTFTGQVKAGGSGALLPASTNLATSVNTSSLLVESQGTGGTAGAAFMSFHRPGAHAANFGIDTDNVWKVGGWSMGAVAYKLWHEGNDGAASGLDADLLDGQHGSYYAANVLTGYSSAPGTVAATDTVLQAIQKLNGNIAAASGNAASSLYLAANFGAL